MKIKSLLICLVVLSGLALASPLFAVSPSSINVDVSPPTPAPNESVNITLSSYAANLDTVTITWLVNGRNVLSGVGQKTLATNAPAAGGKTTIIVKIYLPDGEIDKTMIISPSVMVLLWQATDSYVPPFYKGKALIPSESEVKVVALPEIRSGGTMVNPKNMTYTWQKDYGNQASASGYGKNSFSFVNDYLEDINNVSVTASTLDQKYSSSANVDLPISKPQISFYLKDDTLGLIWENALPAVHNLVGEELIQAAPYFITPKELRLPEMNFSWFINNIAVSISNRSQKTLIPLKTEPGTSGTSRLRLLIENTDKLSSDASREIDIRF